MHDASDTHQPVHAPPTPVPRDTPAHVAQMSARLSRLAAAALFVPTFGVLLVAWMLQPSTAGYGTHTQMGLPQCGFRLTTNLPCPTCGMTTSFSHAAKGDLLSAMAVQPAGAVLAVLTAMAAVVAGYALVTGMSLGPVGQAVVRPRTVLVLGAVLLLGWGYTLVGALGVL